MDFVRARENLVQRMDRELSLPEPVKKAFLAVPREEFVPAHERDAAYVDTALSIGHGATISQPSMLAIMLIELMLEPKMNVLEAGAGCGYFLALLSAMGTHAIGVEISPELAQGAQETLERLGIDAKVIEGDAAKVGFTEKFDRVVFSAAVYQIPDWSKDLLTDGGFVLAPVGPLGHQELIRGYKEYEERTGRLCRFVRFIE